MKKIVTNSIAPIIVLGSFSPAIATNNNNNNISDRLEQKVIALVKQIQDDCLNEKYIQEYIREVRRKHKKYFKNGGRLKIQTWFTITQKDKSIEVRTQWGCRIVPEDDIGVYIIMPPKKGGRPKIRR